MEKLKLYTLVIIIATIALLNTNMYGQYFNDLDKNPHDIVYHRVSKSGVPQIKVVYGRPSAKDEVVFGTQIPYGEIWQTGSNEATEIRFYNDVMFGNKFVKAGTYALYSIPNKNYWTIILNGKTDVYGAHFYNPKFNIAKIEVPAIKGEELINNFSIAFTSKNYGSQMVLAWAKTRVKIPLYTEESLISKI